jgi:hypothetical protein
VMSGRDDRRARALAMWREVMQAEPPPVTDPCTEVTTGHLMGQIRPHRLHEPRSE